MLVMLGKRFYLNLFFFFFFFLAFDVGQKRRFVVVQGCLYKKLYGLQQTLVRSCSCSGIHRT